VEREETPGFIGKKKTTFGSSTRDTPRKKSLSSQKQLGEIARCLPRDEMLEKEKERTAQA